MSQGEQRRRRDGSIVWLCDDSTMYWRDVQFNAAQEHVTHPPCMRGGRSGDADVERPRAADLAEAPHHLIGISEGEGRITPDELLECDA